MSADHFKSLVAKAASGSPLSLADAADAFDIIMDGKASDVQIAAFLTALHMRGETVEEITAAAGALRARALTVDAPADAIDTCGTGGDGLGTLNISTAAAIVTAACGVKIAKHGNRAQSSKCGSADVLEALGVTTDAEPAVVEQCMAVAGIGFAYAPRFHAATRHAGGPRRELGTRTIFNLLGPLTNPANVRHQVVGVYDARWCEPVAAALGALGLRRAAVVHGAGNLDEIAVRGSTHCAIWDADEGLVRALAITPRSFGIDDHDPAGLAGGDAAHNSAVLRRVIAGHQVAPTQAYAAVLAASAMTAALGLELLGDDVLELGRLPDHYKRAAATVSNGAARLVLHKWREVSQNATANLADLARLSAADFVGVE